MHPQRKKRLILVLLVLLGVGVAVALALGALRQNSNLSYTPTEIASGVAPQDARIRAGGMVVAGSLKRSADSLDVVFDVTDGAEQVTITYSGILPDLFREGQGIVALGRLNEDRVLVADEVLAKHDEEYIPPEVAQALDKVEHMKVDGVYTPPANRSGGRMIPELGHVALIIALAVAVLQATIPLYGAWKGDTLAMSFARPAALAQFMFVLFAFLCLIQAFLADDFSVTYVALNSNSALPWYYKVSAVWG